MRHQQFCTQSPRAYGQRKKRWWLRQDIANILPQELPIIGKWLPRVYDYINLQKLVDTEFKDTRDDKRSKLTRFRRGFVVKSKSELTWSQNRVDAIFSTKIKSLLSL